MVQFVANNSFYCYTQPIEMIYESVNVNASFVAVVTNIIWYKLQPPVCGLVKLRLPVCGLVNIPGVKNL